MGIKETNPEGELLDMITAIMTIKQLIRLHIIS